MRELPLTAAVLLVGLAAATGTGAITGADEIGEGTYVAPADTENGDRYVELNERDRIEMTVDGINVRSTATVNDVLEIGHTADSQLWVYVEHDAEQVDVVADGRPIEGPNQRLRIDGGERERVGLEIDLEAPAESVLLEELTIVGGTNSGVDIDAELETVADATATVAVEIDRADTGSTAETYLELRADGDVVETDVVDVDPGETVETTLSHRFASSGEYELAVNGEPVGTAEVGGGTQPPSEEELPDAAGVEIDGNELSIEIPARADDDRRIRIPEISAVDAEATLEAFELRTTAGAGGELRVEVAEEPSGELPDGVEPLLAYAVDADVDSGVARTVGTTFSVNRDAVDDPESIRLYRIGGDKPERFDTEIVNETDGTVTLQAETRGVSTYVLGVEGDAESVPTESVPIDTPDAGSDPETPRPETTTPDDQAGLGTAVAAAALLAAAALARRRNSQR